MRSILVIIAMLAAAGLSAAEHGDHAHKDAGKGDAAKTEVKAYPLDTCIVSGEKLGSMGKPVVQVHEGQEVKFCCKSCVKDFKADPATYIAKIDHAGEAKAKDAKGQDHGEHKGHDHKDHKGHDHKEKAKDKGHEGHDH